MATAAATYTFTTGTTIVAAEVNQNFADLVAFANDETVHKDGSKTMTGALTLPNAEPSGSNVAVRRKSAYRGCVAGHPSLDSFTVAGGTATAETVMATVTNQFGFTPDYDYTLLVLLTGEVTLSVAGIAELEIESPSSTSISTFGGGSNNHLKIVTGSNGEYVAVAASGRRNCTAGTVPTYTVRYKVQSVTALTAWLTGFSWIVPQTRQNPT